MAASSNSTTSPAATGRHHIPLNVGKVVSITAALQIDSTIIQIFCYKCIPKRVRGSECLSTVLGATTAMTTYQ